MLKCSLYLTLVLIVSVSADNRILGGSDTTTDEFPYQASIIYTDYDLSSFHCGGSIVGWKHILTAAHCVVNMKERGRAKVYLGSTNASDGEEYQVESLRWRPEFSGDTLKYDVAMITLTEPIRLGKRVQIIDVVPEGKEPKHGEMLTVAGWGEIAFDSNEMSLVLQKGRIPCIDRRLCRSAWMNGKGGVPKEVTDDMVCAGGGFDKAIGAGDSGSPLVNDKGQLVGIASWGRRPDRKNATGYPSVFVNVAHPFIHGFIRGNSKS